MHYQPYLSLKLLHRYYQKQACPDFVIEPTAVCQRWLRGHRFILKPRENGLQMLVPLVSDQPMIPLAEPLNLTFLLKLKNPAFVSFTQLDPQYRTGRSLYVFSHGVGSPADTLELTATVLQREALSRPVEQQTALERRCSAIAELHALRRSAVFGVVEIQAEAWPSDLSQPRDFTLTFQAKQQTWTYYLIASQRSAAEEFSIQDKATEISFTPAAIAPRDRVTAAIQQRFPQSQPILLKSAAPVACQEAGRPNLQLFRQGHTQPWIPHLPNPPNQHGTQVINVLEDV
ncbi:hypothetical protein [Sphaerothrix gracilis]|uniref:hypothetical protein n=1 Tax=Sphaerothrix gracilis TaxID=3151835 RepID=UPI0031FD5541